MDKTCGKIDNVLQNQSLTSEQHSGLLEFKNKLSQVIILLDEAQRLKKEKKYELLGSKTYEARSLWVDVI